MIVKLYIYNKDTRLLTKLETGNPDYLLLDIGEDEDFTLVRPPNNYDPYKWLDNEWILE